MKHKHESDWARFLRERHFLILDWRAEGQSYEQIRNALSMDLVQVQLISMTPRHVGPDRYGYDNKEPEMPAATTKKRNPNDATFRNVNALKRRVTRLEARVDSLTGAVTRLVAQRIKSAQGVKQPKK